MLSMGKKVWLLNSKKTDGRYNNGVIVGIEKSRDGIFGYSSKQEFFKEFKLCRYKVAYVDVVTQRAMTEWVHHSEVSTTQPE